MVWLQNHKTERQFSEVIKSSRSPKMSGEQDHHHTVTPSVVGFSVQLSARNHSMLSYSGLPSCPCKQSWQSALLKQGFAKLLALWSFPRVSIIREAGWWEGSSAERDVGNACFPSTCRQLRDRRHQVGTGRAGGLLLNFWNFLTLFWIVYFLSLTSFSAGWNVSPPVCHLPVNILSYDILLF